MDGYLVRRDEISAMSGVQKTHFANPDARRVNRSLGDRTGLTGFGFHIIDVEPGCESTEHHLHYHEDECIYVLEGTATAFSRFAGCGTFWRVTTFHGAGTNPSRRTSL